MLRRNFRTNFQLQPGYYRHAEFRKGGNLVLRAHRASKLQIVRWAVAVEGRGVDEAVPFEGNRRHTFGHFKQSRAKNRLGETFPRPIYPLYNIDSLDLANRAKVEAKWTFGPERIFLRNKQKSSGHSGFSAWLIDKFGVINTRRLDSYWSAQRWRGKVVDFWRSKRRLQFWVDFPAALLLVGGTLEGERVYDHYHHEIWLWIPRKHLPFGDNAPHRPML